MNKQRLAIFFLSVGLASMFLYAAIAAFLKPLSWIGFMPQFVRDNFPAELLLTFFSVFEIVLALWLLSGKALYFSSMVAAITLLAITLANIKGLDVVFRDIGIFFAALALNVLSNPNNNNTHG